MGCFSFKCKKCNKALLSDSVSGHQCHLFLLKGGKVIESMSGQYDSYGRCFTEDLSDSHMWSIGWSSVCDLMFTSSDDDGMAAYHQQCYDGVHPTTISEDDPNQGWDDDEWAAMSAGVFK